ncbi:uncharacterized protein LOC108033778 isoform X2 [Drosophila biarmipes]|uniref:uncharacterized protein LOC108033778 isoform X2 n=1 Tax=Drosophila biarmipes TaxID=125945 RepID=UPI0021CC52B9|nr:uncharacterized protein LOC108033778 isoform X2 [Drosophila biarmipes]
MKRKGRSKTSVTSSMDFDSHSEKLSLGRSRALMAARLKRGERSKTSFDSTTGYYSYTDQTSLRRTPIIFSPSPGFMQNAKVKLKLIALYEDHECLWNQCHPDFFNFERKDQIWEAIADEMKLDSPPDFWKHFIHRLRYNVELERIQEQQARFSGGTVQPKLYYADKLAFLNHMFNREKKIIPKEPMPIKPSGAHLENHFSRNLRTLREKPKSRTPISEKLASLEKLRNHQNSKLVLSPEAFQKMQKVTSGGPYYLTERFNKS